MYRERCRPKYSPRELKDIYIKPWEMHPDWADHRARIDVTRTVAQDLLSTYSDIYTAADLSCGDGLWAKEFPHLRWKLGDFAPGYEYRGPIERTIKEVPKVDLFFLCETIEHLDDPDGVVREIRDKTKYLILSTPKSFQWDQNPEHYWAWDDQAIGQILGEAGFRGEFYREANAWGDWGRVNGYAFQIWGCV